MRSIVLLLSRALTFSYPRITSTTPPHAHYYENMSIQRSSIQEEVESRVHRSLHEAHQETVRQLEIAQELEDRAAIAHEAAMRCVRTSANTFFSADRLINRPHLPQFPLGLANRIVRDARRAHRRALDTLSLTASSYQFALTRAQEMEEREAAARVLLGGDNHQNN